MKNSRSNSHFTKEFLAVTYLIHLVHIQYEEGFSDEEIETIEVKQLPKFLQ